MKQERMKAARRRDESKGFSWAFEPEGLRLNFICQQAVMPRH